MTYIEREILLAKRQTVGICDAAGNYYGAADVVNVSDIEDAPAADVVKVVRCRECKYFKGISNLYGEYCCCSNNDGLVRINPDCFCSYGEKQEE